MKLRLNLLNSFTRIHSSTFSTRIDANKSKLKFEKISEKFWMNKSADVNNMCGIGELNEEDLLHSEEIFTKKITKKKFKRALDVGAGIGRITFKVLYDKCDKIDMLDINKNFLDTAKLKQKELQENKIENFYATKIQNFNFEYSYDLVFIQWVLEYLNEENFIKFLSNVALNLSYDGFVIIKENVNFSNDSIIFIEEEGSLIRPRKNFESGFDKAELSICHDELIKYKSVQDEMYDVNCWILSKL